ncbi:MAG: BrnT family toxin [Candidatus Binataceae bacterium]
MGYQWDPAKNAANVKKHGIDFDYAIRAFDGRIVEWPDLRRDYGEPRMLMVGEVEARLITIAFTRRSGDLRIISARRASRNERTTYRQTFPYLPTGGGQD